MIILYNLVYLCRHCQYGIRYLFDCLMFVVRLMMSIKTDGNWLEETLFLYRERAGSCLPRQVNEKKLVDNMKLIYVIYNIVQFRLCRRCILTIIVKSQCLD